MVNREGRAGGGETRRWNWGVRLAWVAVAMGLAAGLADAEGTQPADLRHAAIRGYMQATGARDIEGLLAEDRVGQRSFDAVYGQWYHTVGKVKDSLSLYRQTRYFEALKGIVAMDGRLLADGPQALGLSESDMPKVKALVEAGKSFGKGLADGDIDAALFRKLLLSSGSAVLSVEFLKELLGGQKVAGDVAMVLAMPVAASERAAAAVREVRAAASDPDLQSACERLLDEIANGKRDYARRLVQVLGDGKTAQWLQQKLAAGATAALVLKPLLSQLGLISAAGKATNIVGLLFTGTQIGMSLSGESQAYPHARLAHFADAITPDLLKRWRELRDGLQSGQADVCASFDATSQAVILLAAFIAQEGRLMQEAYRQASLHIAGCKEETFADVTTLAGMYQRWTSGSTFAEYAAGE